MTLPGVRWPKGIKAQGELRDQYNHCIDIVPTVYECLGIELPQEVKGYTQWPLEGTSFKYSFDDASAKTLKPSQFYVMLGTRALWRDSWKVDAVHAGAPSDWGHFAQDKWALYHTETDRSEVHDVGDQHPELRDELVDLWLFQAGQYFGLPLEDRDAISVLTTPAAVDLPAAGPVRLLPRHPGGARGGRRQRPREVIQDRRSGRHPVA